MFEYEKGGEVFCRIKQLQGSRSKPSQCTFLPYGHWDSSLPLELGADVQRKIPRPMFFLMIHVVPSPP